MTLETDRLILRPWEESDAAALYEVASDAEVGPLCGWAPHRSEADSLRVIRDILIAKDTYAIIDRQTNRAIGSIGFHAEGGSITGLPEGEREIGYWLGRPWWGQGLATEAAVALMRHAFLQEKTKAVWAGAFEGNTRSESVQRKLGMQYRFSEFVVASQLHEARLLHVRSVSRKDFIRVHAPEALAKKGKADAPGEKKKKTPKKA